MNWEEAKQLMLDRGYELTSVARNTSSRDIIEMNFIKHIPIPYEFPITIVAQLKTNNPLCDTCWHVELRIVMAPMTMYLYISAGQLPINHPEWDKVEKVISSYGQHCRNFNPLEEVKEIQEFKLDSVTVWLEKL